MGDSSWRFRGACRGMDTEEFFPAYGNEEQTAGIRSVCAGCVVRAQCLREAMRWEGTAPKASRYGVWGGLTPTARDKLATELRRHRAVREAACEGP